MKYLRDMPLAIATPLFVPVKGLETDWLFSRPHEFTDFEAEIGSPSFFYRKTSGNKNQTQVNTK